MTNPLQYTKPVPFEDYHPPAISANLFPGIIGEYAAAVAESIQVPFELPLINSLGVIAAAAQRKFMVQVHQGYCEPLNIFSLAILPPGERKSVAKDACRFPLLEWEVEEQQRVSAMLKLAQAERQVREKASKNLLASARRCKTEHDRTELARQLAILKDEMESLPIPPRLLADDTTPEALAALMALHGQRIAMIEAEGGFLDTLAGRYSSGVPNLDVVLKAWSGEAVRIDRRHADPIVLNEPTLTLILSAQPDVLAGTAQIPSFRGRGLLGRFLFLLPKSLVGSRNIETFPIPESLKQRYRATVRNIIELPWNANSADTVEPYFLSMNHDARAEWHSFAAKIEKELAEGASLSGMRDWGGKLSGQALRLAGLCHLTLHNIPQNQCIEGETMRSVLQLADILIEHAKAAFYLMGADASIECAKAILQWIITEKLESITARSCLDKVKGKWPKMSLVNPGLAVLEERGFILLNDRGVLGRGRSSRVYTVNPLTFGEKS